MDETDAKLRDMLVQTRVEAIRDCIAIATQFIEAARAQGASQEQIEFMERYDTGE